MDDDAYVEHLQAEARQFAVAVRKAGLGAPVPTCRLQRRPEEREWAKEPPAGLQLLDWFETTLDELVAELRSRGSQAPAYTWYPSDQTVGFWHRRMAHETLVHRIDAELADGDVSWVDDQLGIDGIDEMLVKFLGGPWWEADPVPEASGRTVAVRAASAVWRVTLEPDEVRISRDEGVADASVEGPPLDVLMWVWGREAAAIRVSGEAVTELRDRLGYFT